MITLLTRKSPGDPCVSVCRADADIWDTVLKRCAGMRLETISRAADAADAELMFSRADAAASEISANIGHIGQISANPPP